MFLLFTGGKKAAKMKAEVADSFDVLVRWVLLSTDNKTSKTKFQKMSLKNPTVERQFDRIRLGILFCYGSVAH